MNKEELIERLKGYEWDDVEFKRARKGVPEDAYSTVSAFANTSGGWLVFGVRQEKGQFIVSGVEDVDKVQNDFLSCLRAGDKLSRSIDVQGHIHNIGGQIILAFYVPELHRSEKPAYLKGDPRQSFIRRGGGDERCTPRELERFLRDAAKEPYDSELIEGVEPENFFDAKALGWYRKVFNEREPGRHEMLDDQEFLREWNFLIDEGGKCAVTRCALLLFGKARHIRRWLPRPVVDLQIIQDRFEEWSPERRWADRIVIEDNIIQAWLAIVERYMKYADRPFEIDSATLRRHDEPPDYISFREAAINLLIHQDYGDSSRNAQIQLFRDRTRFWNPGDAFGTVDQLLEPGAKELRNPNLVGAFRRIGLSDQAGTGIRAIFRNWRQLGNIPPKIVNQQAEKAFELTLMKEVLISDHQKRFQRELGASLGENQAAILAYACREGQVSLTDAKAITGLGSGAAAQELERLVVDVLLKPVEPGRLYALADHLRGRYIQEGESGGHCLLPENGQEGEPGPSWDQVGTKLGLSPDQVLVLQNIISEQPIAELLDVLGRTNRTKFRDQVLNPLIEAGLVEMTHPDKPKSSKQRYRLSQKARGIMSPIQQEGVLDG